jgi:DNA-binding beta-propeller fold protein YncE
VYVADTWNQRIEVFNASGRFLRRWGGGQIGSGPGDFYGPRSIAVSRSGRVYVADTGNRRIQVFTTKGRYLFAFGASGTGPGQFQEPSAIAVGPRGQVYVADFWNQRIQELSPSGHYIRSWTVPGWTPQSYDEPYLVVEPNGLVVVSDPQTEQVLVYGPTGQLRGAFGSSALSLPIGVVARPDGRIAVSDATANRVRVFSVSSAPTVRPLKKVHAATSGPKR